MTNDQPQPATPDSGAQPKVVRMMGPAEAVTGVHLMQGIGHQPAKGFWADAWSRVVRRPGPILALSWLGIIIFFAVFAPFLASGHPIILTELQGERAGRRSSPMFNNLRPTDILLALGAIVWVIVLLLPSRWPRSERLAALFVCSVQVGLIVVACAMVKAMFRSPDASPWQRSVSMSAEFPWIVAGSIALVISTFIALIPFLKLFIFRLLIAWVVGVCAAGAVSIAWEEPLASYNYRVREARGEIKAVYTLIPFSPGQGSTSLDLRKPRSTPLSAVINGLTLDVAREHGLGSFRDDPRWQVRKRPTDPLLEEIPITDRTAESLALHLRANSGLLPRAPDVLLEEFKAARGETFTNVRHVIDWLGTLGRTRFWLGTDSLGQDVLSQMLHACRLSISIGLVSTGIAVIIGVTMGALMGYFGGWVDMLLYRVVEVFMAIPVLFLLIVAAAVLPRNTYVMMVIIGCVSWTGAARFIRAEFYKLRGQDFVQSARAVGLPLPSILFKHMLPNGVTPVLVDASFAIAAAILAEAILSFLGLGPANQASWGRLLSDANNQVGDFVPWLAIFPGLAIFLTVLAYNILGESLRDAIDPKLKKARV